MLVFPCPPLRLSSRGITWELRSGLGSTMSATPVSQTALSTFSARVRQPRSASASSARRICRTRHANERSVAVEIDAEHALGQFRQGHIWKRQRPIRPRRCRRYNSASALFPTPSGTPRCPQPPGLRGPNQCADRHIARAFSPWPAAVDAGVEQPCQPSSSRGFRESPAWFAWAGRRCVCSSAG